MVGFSIQLSGEVGGCRGTIADANGVLDQPFIDGFCGVGHEDAAAEIGLGEDVGEAHRMVEVEAINHCVSRRLFWSWNGRKDGIEWDKRLYGQGSSLSLSKGAIAER